MSATLLAEVRYDANGLIPAVAQDHASGEVLMVAWMNAESLRETLETGQDLRPPPDPEGAAPGLRRRHAAAAGRTARPRLPHQPPQLLLPRVAGGGAGDDQRAACGARLAADVS